MSRKPTSNRPEKKIGPYPGGIGVAIWLNMIDTDQGQRQIRSITLNPRRYRDSQSGMRWTVKGAQSLLHLRALYLNGDWPPFIGHRIQQEQDQLYPYKNLLAL